MTETTGIPVSREGAGMMYTRYDLGAELARGRRVLELGCGTGQGLGLLGSTARWVVGGDISMPLLRSARGHYGSRFPLVRLSADTLPFRNASFDLVLCFEASYYVADMAAGFGEVGRVLAPGGCLLFVNANPERPDFIRSPHSTHYHSADEFRSQLERLGFDVLVEGAFPIDVDHHRQLPGKLLTWTLSVARRALEHVGIVPRTLRGRARLKRLVYGKLLEVPSELPRDFAPVAARTRLESGGVPGYKVLYVTGRKVG